jgi:hypothetical protein
VADRLVGDALKPRRAALRREETTMESILFESPDRFGLDTGHAPGNGPPAREGKG